MEGEGQGVQTRSVAGEAGGGGKFGRFLEVVERGSPGTLRWAAAVNASRGESGQRLSATGASQVQLVFWWTGACCSK